MNNKKIYCAKPLLVVLLFITILNTICFAQPNNGQDSLEAVRISKLPIVVRAVYKYDREDSIEHSGGIGDIIVVVVDNLDSLLKKAKASEQNVSLFINGRKIDNIKPISGAPDKDKGTLQYRLDRNSGNDKTWADILGAPPFFNRDFFYKEVKISVGLEKEFAVKTFSDENNFTIIRIHKGRFWLCCFLVVLYLFVVIVMSKRKGLLKDRSIDLSVIGISGNVKHNTYSLARFQMAFWFTLTIVSFFFIWVITDAYDIITPTILALIGISAGTSLSATVIDDSKKTETLNQTIKLQEEKVNLGNEIQILDQQLRVDTGNIEMQKEKKSKESLVVEKTAQIARNIVVLSPQESEGFFNDILKDVNGVSFHRVQLLVWTFILGLIFLHSVWKSLSMPEFSATLLALQGLTAGTYLGFKFPEKHA